ncbi:MAG: DUF2238 domain-containing protein [Pseudomonadales bacterium]|nr:DUF2238 domain-containing protein [Pseudomonadales bacterium]
MHQNLKHRVLLVPCAIFWLITAFKPHDLEAWALEQLASIICIVLLVRSTKLTAYSVSALVGATVLFICHTIGTHYTYSLTPYNQFFAQVSGISINGVFGWERNHYDRFVHFLYGLVTARLLYEFFISRLTKSSVWAWSLSLNFVLSTSAIYELMEWAAAVIPAPETGALYLGAQGDIWDAQVDIALASLGSLLAPAIYYLELLKDRRRKVRFTVDAEM